MRTQNTISAGGQNVAGYIGEIAWFADSILRKNHVWADGAPIDAEQWPELAEYASMAGWDQNEDGQYLTPDLSGRVLISASDTHAVGTEGGEEQHKQTVDELVKHVHEFEISGEKIDGIAIYGQYQLNGISYGASQPRGGSPSMIKLKEAGKSMAFNIMQPYYTAKAQILAKGLLPI